MLTSREDRFANYRKAQEGKSPAPAPAMQNQMGSMDQSYDSIRNRYAGHDMGMGRPEPEQGPMQTPMYRSRRDRYQQMPAPQGQMQAQAPMRRRNPMYAADVARQGKGGFQEQAAPVNMARYNPIRTERMQAPRNAFQGSIDDYR